MSAFADLDVLRQAVLGRSLAQMADTPLQTPRVSIRVFNRAEDKDEDAVFGAKAHIAFDLQSAWVKYKMSLKHDERAAVAPAVATASAQFELSDYRIHDATSPAWNAFSRDLTAPRSLLSLDDVRSLQPGEALAMEAGGALSASVSFSWSDVFASKLGEIVQGLVPRLPLAVKLKAGLDVNAKVKVADQFSIIISRTRDAQFRIAVKKAKSRDHTFGIDVSVDFETSAVPAIDDALDALFEALGAEGNREEAAAEELRKELRKRLADAARWKASAGFAYEYARIDEQEAIADFILLDQSRLAGDYALAMSGNFAALTDALRRDPTSRTLVRYLNETTLTRRSSGGFSLGIGKWTAIEAKDSSVFKLTTRTSLDGFQLMTARGTRRYDEKLLARNDFEWIVDLKAQMKEFVEKPSTLDFDYGLHCTILLERAKLAAGDLDRMLDFACSWDVCAPDRELFADAIGRKASIRVQLILEQDALAATLSGFTDSLDAWAEALAMAMPYARNFPERRAFAARRDTYTPAWRAWLADRSSDPMTLLRPRLRSGLVLLEERRLPGSFAWISGEGHPQLRKRLGAFLRGASALHGAMTSAQPPATIGEAYGALQQFWSQRLYIAAFGRAMLDRAYEAGVHANVTLQVEYPDATLSSRA